MEKFIYKISREYRHIISLIMISRFDCAAYIHTYVHVSYASSWKAKELATHLVIPVVTTSFFLVFVIAFRLT